MMKWNWQHPDWPEFTYDHSKLISLEAQFLKSIGEVWGVVRHISEDDQEQLKIELISEEALKTSKIEGELLDRNSVQSSICKHFGLKTDSREIPPAEQGIAAMMVSLYQTFDAPLDHESLFNWHRLLMNGRQDILDVGRYRTHTDSMRIVSGPIYNPNIYFEAPPSDTLFAEMAEFIRWFNTTKETIPPPIHAGIAHLYFVCIHPFEDGNGRIGRALSEKSLAQGIGYPTLIALSDTIERERKRYYHSLESNNRDLDITDWLIYFAETVLAAQRRTIHRIEFIIYKTRLYARLHDQLNHRQSKALQRLFQEGIDGFKGGLSAQNYIAITKAPRTTATRDLNELVEMGALVKTGTLRYTRYHLPF